MDSSFAYLFKGLDDGQRKKIMATEKEIPDLLEKMASLFLNERSGLHHTSRYVDVLQCSRAGEGKSRAGYLERKRVDNVLLDCNSITGIT
jgi:hypothetical protein